MLLGTNTIDVNAPTTTVENLPENVGDTLTVSWTGEDVIFFRNDSNETYLFALGTEAQNIHDNFPSICVKEGVAFKVAVSLYSFSIVLEAFLQNISGYFLNASVIAIDDR